MLQMDEAYEDSSSSSEGVQEYTSKRTKKGKITLNKKMKVSEDNGPSQPKISRRDSDEDIQKSSDSTMTRTSNNQVSGQVKVSTIKQTGKRPAFDGELEESDTVDAEQSKSSYSLNDTHTAGDLKKSLHGNDYQLKLLMLFAYICTCINEAKVAFRLATEMAEAGKFDDLVLRYGVEGNIRYRFLQAKNRQFLGEENKIKVSDLKSSSHDNDFSLQKYFISYLCILLKEEFQDGLLEYFIICTNTNLDFELNLGKREQEKTKDAKEKWKNYFDEIQTSDKILNLGGKRYKFSNDSKKRENIISELKPIFKCALNRNHFVVEKIKVFLSNDKKHNDNDRNKPLDEKFDKFFDDKINEFLDKLVFAVEQPSGKILDQKIKEKIGNEFNLISDSIYNEFYKYMFDWMQHRIKEKGKAGEGKACFLTHENVKAFFNDAKQKVASLVSIGPTSLYRNKIKEFEITFTNLPIQLLNFLTFTSTKQVFNIISPHETILSAIKVDQTIDRLPDLYKKDDSHIFTRLKDLLILPQLTEAFKLETNNLLVIECQSTCKVNYIRTLYNQLSKILKKYSTKKIILITHEDDALANNFEEEFSKESASPKDKYKKIVDTSSNFNNLTGESQRKLLEKGKVVFQGNETSLGTLITNKDLKELIDEKTLFKLINGDEIEIGYELQGLGETEYYYIDRTLNRHIKIENGFLREKSQFFVTSNSQVDESILQENQDIVLISNTDAGFKELCDNYDKKRNVHWFKKENYEFVWQQTQGNLSKLREFIVAGTEPKPDRPEKITDISDKVMIISAEPGMGKSILLTYLAMKTKTSNLAQWVEKINLVDCSSELEAMEGKKFNKEEVIKFLLKTIKFKTKLEEELFKYRLNCRDKITLLFDGFDEISPDYKEKVIELLKILKCTTTEKVMVTSRPYGIISELEDNLGSFSHTLNPFSEENQENFFMKFWENNLKLDELDKKRSQTFIHELLNRFSQSTNDQERKFVSIPLHLRIIAEVFQDTFKEFYESCSQELSSKQKQKFSKKLNLVTLYEHFIERKFKNIRFVEKKAWYKY